MRNSSPNQKLRTAEPNTHDKTDKTRNNNRGWCRIVNTLRQGNEANYHFQKTLKEKVIPPLRVAETQTAWLWQAAADDRRARCQMVTRSAATGTKSPDLNLQHSSNDIRPETYDPKAQTKIEQPDESCVFGVSCCAGPAGVGWHPRARPSRGGSVGWCVKGQISKGSWRSTHCPSGCSWDPAAEVKRQAGNNIMTLPPIGWKNNEELGNRAPGVTRKWQVALKWYKHWPVHQKVVLLRTPRPTHILT